MLCIIYNMKMREKSDRNTKIIKEFISKSMFNKNIYNHKNNDFTRISIVMPSYNQGEFIERSILSVLNQNYPNTKLITQHGKINGKESMIYSYEEKVKELFKIISFYDKNKKSNKNIDC